MAFFIASANSSGVEYKIELVSSNPLIGPKLSVIIQGLQKPYTS